MLSFAVTQITFTDENGSETVIVGEVRAFQFDLNNALLSLPRIADIPNSSEYRHLCESILPRNASLFVDDNEN